MGPGCRLVVWMFGDTLSKVQETNSNTTTATFSGWPTTTTIVCSHLFGNYCLVDPLRCFYVLKRGIDTSQQQGHGHIVSSSSSRKACTCMGCHFFNEDWQYDDVAEAATNFHSQATTATSTTTITTISSATFVHSLVAGKSITEKRGSDCGRDDC
jgi:hypothetical protein